MAPNVEFIVEDAEDAWIGNHYDFIHIRTLVGAIKDWPGLLTNIFNHLNLGGWVEICDFEYVFKSQIDRMDLAPDIVSWTDGLDEAATKFGRRMDVAVHLKEWVKMPATLMSPRT